MGSNLSKKDYMELIRKLNTVYSGLAPTEVEDPDIGTIDDVTTAAKVILFNDDWHSFDEVINQLMKAVKCTQEKAEALTVEVHEKGKACVYSGDLPECLKVSGILEEIALHTQIEM